MYQEIEKHNIIIWLPFHIIYTFINKIVQSTS